MDKDSGSAIEGAEIRVACGKKVSVRGTSDSSGQFRVWGSTGIVPKDPCDVSIDKAGYVSGSPSVEDCGSQWTDCRRDLGRVELTKK